MAEGNGSAILLSQCGPVPHLYYDCTSLGAPPWGPLGTAVCVVLVRMHPPVPSPTRQGLLPGMPLGKLRPRQAGNLCGFQTLTLVPHCCAPQVRKLEGQAGDPPGG